MLPKHDLHLKLSKDKKTFTGVLSQWDIRVIGRRQRIWIAKITFLPPDALESTDYQTQEAYESKLALDALLKAEGLPTRIGIADAAQTYLSLLDLYSIRVTWDAPPLSSARRLSMRDILPRPALSPAKHTPAPIPAKKTQQTPPLAPVRRSSNAKRSPASRPPVNLPTPETPISTSAYPLWETSVVPELPKGSWYGD